MCQRGGPMPRTSDSHQPVQSCPLLDGNAFSVQKLPAKGACQSESAIIGCATADPDHTTSCSFCRSSCHDNSKPKRIEVERMKPSRRQLRQTDHSRGFDDGSPRFRLPPPCGPAFLVGCVQSDDALNLRIEYSADHLAEPIAAIA